MPRMLTLRNREEEPVGSAAHRSRRHRSRHLVLRSPAAVPETILGKRLALAQHVVDRPPELGCQHAHGFAWSALLLVALLPAPGPLTDTQHQTRCLGKRPLQWALPILLLPLPTFLPSDSCAQRTRRP